MNKKNFSENPAMQFITPGNLPDEAQSDSQNSVPDGYKINPMYIETKTKRVQLVMQPSLYEKAKAAADDKGLSFNSYVHQVLEEALKESNH